jgi:lipoprotein-releasing system ATP-binding protein
MSVLLRATNIVKRYQQPQQSATEVLRGASIDVQANESVAIMAPSGAGKSTLLHILASLELPTSGTVELHTKQGLVRYADLGGAERARIRNVSIGMIFQFHHLLPEFSVEENVQLPLLIAGQQQSLARTKAREMLDRVGLAHKATARPVTLSGGEQQRVAIARALIHQPVLVIADEPTGNLDDENAEIVANLLFTLQREDGNACIVATHNTGLAARTNRIVTITNGLCSLQ